MLTCSDLLSLHPEVFGHGQRILDDDPIEHVHEHIDLGFALSILIIFETYGGSYQITANLRGFNMNTLLSA